MGAVARVKVQYADLAIALRELPENIPVYGTYLNGETIYDTRLSRNGVIIMGNEGNGISKDVFDKLNKNIYIPMENTESLNVSVAASIIMYKLRWKKEGD